MMVSSTAAMPATSQVYSVVCMYPPEALVDEPLPFKQQKWDRYPTGGPECDRSLTHYKRCYISLY